MEQQELQNQMLKPCTQTDILQVYYADMFMLLRDLKNLYDKFYLECDELNNLYDFVQKLMTARELNTQFDDAILRTLHAIHSDIESNADNLGKELWSARKLYSRISNMNKPIARQRALQARNLSEYGVLMNKIYSGEQTI